MGVDDSERIGGDRVPLGTHRAQVIDELVRGISAEESRARRRAVLRRNAKMLGVVLLLVSVVLFLDPKARRSDWTTTLLMVALAAPFLVIEYHRLKPRAAVTREQAERLAPAGPACARCGEVPIEGMAVCPSCRNLLRPWAVLVPSAAVLLLLLLAVLYRHGAFQS